MELSLAGLRTQANPLLPGKPEALPAVASPAHSVRNRRDGRPCHRASDPKTLCALCVLCGENGNAKPQRTQGPQRRNNFKGSLGQLQRTDGAEQSYQAKQRARDCAGMAFVT